MPRGSQAQWNHHHVGNMNHSGYKLFVQIGAILLFIISTHGAGRYLRRLWFIQNQTKTVYMLTNLLYCIDLISCFDASLCNCKPFAVQLDECGTICSAFLGRKSLRFLQNGHVSPCLRCPKIHKVLMTSEFEKWNPYSEELKRTAAYIAQPGKGILASDESNATTGKRLATVGLDNTEANRQAWRELLYSAPALGNYISGTIMFEETLFQSSRDGIEFVEILKKQGIVPGIKVDTGLQPIDGTDGETATQGLDGLGERCKRYYAQGARFAKWRAVIKVDSVKHPSSTSILENVHGLARYAHIAQANGLVPIVEPEVTLGPGDYSIERTAYISEKVNSHVFRFLNEYNVILEGILLKPNMILPGLDVPTPPPEEVAKHTLRTMLRSVPGAVPGIHFLSGGMSEEEATLNLNALQAYGPTPWSLTFSYGRALQSSTLKIWSGKEENWKAAQERLVALAKANSEAQLGKYTGPHPSPGGTRILQTLRLGGAGK